MRTLLSPFQTGTLVALGALAGCLAAPPGATFSIADGTVRADDPDEAEAIAALLAEVRPRLEELLPETRTDPVEIWIQETPRLYAFPLEATSDAEGLYAPSQDRILLSSGLEDVERVLAHELVHACLGPAWAHLPGTLEEGLCDVVAARVSSAGVGRLRAGRLSSAALSCGGLQLSIRVQLPRAEGRSGWSSRVSLSSDERVDEPARDVFRVAAGLSSTRLEPNIKRGLYGLSFLLVERVVAARGFDGLHRMCLDAEAEGLSAVPRRSLLEAAGLDEDPETWRLAAARALGDEDLLELARMYPGIVADVVLSRGPLSPTELEGLSVEIGCVGANARARVEDVGAVRRAILDGNVER